MPSFQVSQLMYAFGIGSLMSFYGIVSTIVWFAGEKLNYPVSERIVIIAVVLLTLPVALVGMFVAARRKKKKDAAEAAAVAAAGQPTEASAAGVADASKKLTNPTGNYDELTQSAEETVQFLKSSNLGAGKDVVYSLPWYIVAGTPKSGKSSLSLASGLNFQNLPSQRQSEQKFIRPTRNVDWRVTSDAVFLDTAGRYQTEGADGDEWSALLEVIKKYRPARPIDGMIVPISAERILHADDAEIEQMAKVLRARVDEAIQRTKIRFPVYLVFTHADSIEGFRDSFSTSQKEGQTLVWGATIPIEKSQNAHAMFDPEYDLLHESVMKRRLMRLSAPFPPVRQLKIFNFPIHFGSARKKLGHFIATLFRPNPFSESPFLRGFYFTAVPVNRPQGKPGQTMTNMAQTVGQSYFTEKLFRDVILRDKDLVATQQSQQVRAPIMGWLLTFAGAMLAILLLALAGFSLYQNKLMVDKATERGEAVLTMVKADRDRNPLTKKPEEARDEIDKIESLRQSLVDLDNNERDGAPILMRMGLYSGNRIYREKLLPIYLNAIEQRFKEPTVRKLEDDLRKFATSNAVANSSQLTPQEEDTLGKNYDLLKAYLMLSGAPEYRPYAEPSSISNALADYWKTESKTPDGMQQIALENLNFWAKQIDRKDSGDKYLIAIQPQGAIVDASRKKLQAFPAVFRYYKRVTTEISKKVDAVSADSVLAGRSAGVLEGSYTVPGAYTVDGYRNYMKDAISKAQEELTKDDWVMNEKSSNVQAQSMDVQKLESKYFNDYTDNWRKFVRGINVASYKTNADAINSLKAFSNTESPMKIVLEEIAKQTNLSANPAPKGWIDWIMSFFQPKKPAQAANDTIVEKEFRPLFTFAGSGSEKAEQSPISQYGADMKKLSDDLETRSPDQLRQITDEVAAEKGKFVSLLNTVEKSVNTKTEGFNVTGSGKEIADLLKRPLNNLKDLFGAGVQKQIEKAWTNEVLPKAKEVEKGYPFTNDGEADLTKLTAYLNPQNGTLSDFYDKRLKKYFEESNGQLKVLDTSEVKFSPEFVTYLNSALKLREALFGKNSTPQFTYDFKMQKVADSIIEVTIDGQKIDSNGTGSTTFKFPAQSGDTGAAMNFASTGDTSTAPAVAPTPAASPATTGTPAKTTTTTPPTSGVTNIKYPGTWGLFKFVEAGGAKKQPTGEYTLTYKLGGKDVQATVKPSGGDLFDRTLFTNTKAPDKF